MIFGFRIISRAPEGDRGLHDEIIKHSLTSSIRRRRATLYIFFCEILRALLDFRKGDLYITVVYFLSSDNFKMDGFMKFLFFLV